MDKVICAFEKANIDDQKNYQMIMMMSLLYHHIFLKLKPFHFIKVTVMSEKGNKIKAFFEKIPSFYKKLF